MNRGSNALLYSSLHILYYTIQCRAEGFKALGSAFRV